MGFYDQTRETSAPRPSWRAYLDFVPELVHWCASAGGMGQSSDACIGAKKNTFSECQTMSGLLCQVRFLITSCSPTATALQSVNSGYRPAGLSCLYLVFLSQADLLSLLSSLMVHPTHQGKPPSNQVPSGVSHHTVGSL